MLPAMIRPTWRSLRRSVRSAGPHPHDAQLHRIRIRAKQLRYASEAASPVIGKAARRSAAAAEELQAVLGDFQDAVSAETWLRREALCDTTGAGEATGAGFAAGVLVGHQQHRQQELRHRWPPAWKALARKKRRRWLRRR
jgi:CHAD domain-containing protein